MKKICSLFLITCTDSSSDKKENKVIFSMFKEIYSIDKKRSLFSLEKKGIFLFKDSNIEYKQWFFCGSVDEIDSIFNEITSKNYFEIDSITFSFPKMEKKDDYYENGEYSYETKNALKDIPFSEKYVSTVYKLEEHDYLEKFNFEIIKEQEEVFKSKFNGNEAGYSNSMRPYGYINLDLLYNYIKKDIILIKKELFFENDFRGDADSKNKEDRTDGPLFFKGYVNVDDRRDLFVKVTEMDTLLNDDYNLVKIDEKTGTWRATSGKRIWKGQIIYKKNNKIICGSKFHLMKNIELNINIHSKKDNNSLIEKGTIIKFESNKHFDNNDYRNHNDYKDAVISYLEKILSACTPDILIVDPYFLGDITLTDNKGQEIFLQALENTINNYEVNSISFLGNGKNFPVLKIPYIKLKKILEKSNIKFLLKKSNNAPHDRHIIKLDENKERRRIISIGASINGWGKNEINFNENKSSLSVIYAKIVKIFNEGDSVLLDGDH